MNRKELMHMIDEYALLVRSKPLAAETTQARRDLREAIDAALRNARNSALLRELQAADRIIGNALQIMTQEQKSEWARMNDAADLIESGTTRHHERAAVIAQALGEQA